MLFKDVIGQHAVKQHLTEMVEQNRLSHALLFLGKEGSGALPWLETYTKSESSGPTSDDVRATAASIDDFVACVPKRDVTR